MSTVSRSHRQAQRGQSLVEFAVVLPLLFLLVGGAFTMWTGLHAGIGVTSAARAGALTAASQLATNKVQPAAGPGAPYTAAQLAAVLGNAASAVTAEDGVVTYYAAPCSAGQACVSIGSKNVPTGSGTYLPVVIVSVTQSIAPQVPMLTRFTIRASAACPATGAS